MASLDQYGKFLNISLLQMGVLIKLTLAFILMWGGIREYERASLHCERHFTCHSLYYNCDEGIHGVVQRRCLLLSDGPEL